MTQIRFALLSFLLSSISLSAVGGTLGESLVLDTRNQAACDQVKRDLQIESLCYQDPTRPLVQVTRLQQMPVRRWDLPSRMNGFMVGAVATMGTLFAMPESVTHWSKDDLDRPWRKWKENVSSAPVIDQDDWIINYVGHPISGSIYYVVARQADLTPMQSFGFSVLMSTFYWEYGIEAIAERPSKQDLVLTPLLGSLLGEILFQMKNAAEAQGDRLLGSKFLGKTVIFIADPLAGMEDALDKLEGKGPLKSIRSQWTSIPYYDRDGRLIDRGPGWQLQIDFKN